ncbi:cyclic nucleotide-binding domain-containing protein [Acidithiobacillus sp. AMEEHan]|uniref:cyclic nucleotide-binding domain-containing protein n=1 Tax=Acidithiobacillus sp. AMEEHan TaxID=2994951 RepID=UPI0027E4FE16|nr:cyclic nucleotide-binding domain-containing protein [Acidithiobacillus sp. AMEEHan]
MTEDLLPYAARLRQQPLFAVWSPSQLETLLGECRLHACENGDLLFIEKDPAEQFYFLDAGVVELLSTSAEGKEKVVEIMQAGDLFAEAVAFMGEDTRSRPDARVKPECYKSLFCHLSVFLRATRVSCDASLVN